MPLIIVIDKDNDFGRKAGVKGPIIGEERIWDAVHKFAMEDPEDSDLNAALVAIKMSHDIGGIPVIICGKSKTGYGTIAEIKAELKKVIEITGHRKAILITDGAEDDTIIPVISNEIEIIDVYHVAVKQLKGLETTIYILLNYFKEFFWSKKTKNLTAIIFSSLFLVYGSLKILSIWYPTVVSYFSKAVIGVISIIFSLYFASIALDGRELRMEGSRILRFVGYFASVIVLIMGGISAFIQQTTFEIIDRIFASIFGSILVFFLTKAIYYNTTGSKKYVKYIYLSTVLPGLYGIINIIMKTILLPHVMLFDIGYALLWIGVSLLLFILSKKYIR